MPRVFSGPNQCELYTFNDELLKRLGGEGTEDINMYEHIQHVDRSNIIFNIFVCMSRFHNKIYKYLQ